MLLFLEVNVIGTLRASGYTRGELIRHYMVMPMLVIAALMKKKENRAEDKTETADVEEMPEEKAEEEAPVLMDTGEKTVYVKADAKGNVKEVTLETLMKDEDGVRCLQRTGGWNWWIIRWHDRIRGISDKNLGGKRRASGGGKGIGRWSGNPE